MLPKEMMHRSSRRKLRIQWKVAQSITINAKGKVAVGRGLKSTSARLLSSQVEEVLLRVGEYERRE